MITVKLLKPGKNTTITYDAEELRITPDYALVRAHWSRPRLELGYVTFEPGDTFLEHFYATRWYNIFDIRGENGARKGWYCNVTRPAQIADGLIVSEDLELDLFVSVARDHLLRLDIEEFEARGLAHSDPATYAAAYAALDELEYLAQAALPPFDAGALW